MSDVNENRPLDASRRAASGRCLRTYPEASLATRVIPGIKDAGMLAYLAYCSCRLPDHRFTVPFLSCLLIMVRVNAQLGNGISRGCLPAHTSVGGLTDEVGVTVAVADEHPAEPVPLDLGQVTDQAVQRQSRGWHGTALPPGVIEALAPDQRRRAVQLKPRLRLLPPAQDMLRPLVAE
jgi:hypothetical protein